MKDFEDLLKDVLDEDSQIEPLPGMEARIQARAIATQTSRPRWTAWTLVAAGTLLIAVLTGRESQKMLGWRRIQVTEIASKAELPPTLVRDESIREVPVAHSKRHTAKWGKTGAVEVVSLPRVSAIQIEPLEVAALSLEPLGVAALQVTKVEDR